MIEEILKLNSFSYKSNELQKLKEEKFIFAQIFYITYMEFLLLSEDENLYAFVVRNHDSVNILIINNFEPKYFIVNIRTINDLYLFYNLFKFKIIKLNTIFLESKKEDINELFNNNIFKIMDNYEILINVKFHDNLNIFIDFDDVINYLYSLNDIIDFKKNILDKN